MVYLLHHPEDLNEVEKKLVPQLGDRKLKLIVFPVDPNFKVEEDAIFLTYLNDEFLKKFLPFASEKSWSIGILPHPHLNHSIKGLGI